MCSRIRGVMRSETATLVNRAARDSAAAIALVICLAAGCGSGSPQNRSTLTDPNTPTTVSACAWHATINRDPEVATGHLATLVDLTNVGREACPAPTVRRVVCVGKNGKPVEAGSGSFFPIKPAPSRIAVGARVTFVVSTYTFGCAATSQRPVTELRLWLNDAPTVQLGLAKPLETACEFRHGQPGTWL
jgi:hypothetical protein